jgi:pimeloyl-ACP methyl ester carboxylesterase
MELNTMLQNGSVVIRDYEIDGYAIRTLIKRNPVKNDKPANPLLILNGVAGTLEMLKPLSNVYDAGDLISFEIPTPKSFRDFTLIHKMRRYALLANKLLDKLSLETVDILGYSWGGALAQEVVKRYPKRCNKLILAATSAGNLTIPGAALFSTQVLDPKLLSDPSKLFNLVQTQKTKTLSSSRDSKPLNKYQNKRLHLSNKAYIHQLLALASWSSIFWLRRLQNDTLVLHAQDDKLVSCLNAHLLATLIPNAQSKIYATGGHMFALNQPQSFVDDVVAFLKN